MSNYEIRRDGTGHYGVYRDGFEYIGFVHSVREGKRLIRKDTKKRKRFKEEAGKVVYAESTS